jgi:group I intron endonuclease
LFYTIYKITNNLNDKFYVGKHKTIDLNDGYMGSGKLIKHAIEKYGLENFTKEILHVFDNEEDMNNKEKALVVLSEESYNLCLGGHGGFGYINSNESLRIEKNKKAMRTVITKYKEKMSEWGSKGGKKKYEKYGVNEKWLQAGRTSFLGKQHSKETKESIGLKNSIHQTGSKNSQYGTCWITNGKENKKIKKEELDIWIEKGYYRGRIIAGLV